MRVEKCVQGGAGFAHLPDGSVCFVENALPGELVEIKITERKKDFAKAFAIKILEPNENRINPSCKYYGKCGGCNAQHAKFEFQIELLRQITLDLFSRIAKLNLPQNFEIHHGAEWGYRCRAQVFATGSKNTPLGFQARSTNDIVPIEHCPVLTPNLNKSLNPISYTPRPKAKCNIFDNLSETFLGKYIYADENVFFQSNMELLPKLLNAVKKEADSGELFLDIFCGVGLFSAFLQNEFERVIAVEQNHLCQKFAEKNLGKNCEFYPMNAEEWLQKNTELLSKAVVLIDPPRTGISNEAYNILCKNKSKKLIYVSCNPATLARDTRKLLNEGYNLANIEAFAFYPQTFHLEMLAVFQPQRICQNGYGA